MGSPELREREQGLPERVGEQDPGGGGPVVAVRAQWGLATGASTGSVWCASCPRQALEMVLGLPCLPGLSEPQDSLQGAACPAARLLFLSQAWWAGGTGSSCLGCHNL